MNFKKQYLAKEDDLYFIAEIGINHNGLFDLAINMIDKSKEAGAKAVKFQKRNPEYKNTLYLDKDGVLNTAFYRSSKLSSPRNLDEVNIKQDIEDILIFSKKKFNLVVISNQPDISRKLITKEFINENLEIIRAYLPISIAIVCPHLKESNCLCRKPNTGMIQKFRELFPDNHESEIFVGDQISDQECADGLNIHFIKVDNPTSLKNNLEFTF